MKVYLIMHGGKPTPYKACGWVDYKTIGKNGIYIKSVMAFLKRKEAKKWMEERGKGWDELVIKTATIN